MTKVKIEMEADIFEDGSVSEIRATIDLGDKANHVKAFETAISMSWNGLTKALYIDDAHRERAIELADLMSARLRRLTEMLHEKEEMTTSEFNRKVRQLERIM